MKVSKNISTAVISAAVGAETTQNKRESAKIKNKKMKTKTKTFILLAALICCFGAGVANGQTTVASGTCGDNLTWVLTSDSVLTISGSGAMTNYTSTNIPWYSYRSAITSLTIGNSVTSIGSYAFYGCLGLTGTLTIPNSVTSIGNYAFFGCSGLTSVTIPNSVTTIGDRAFYNCSGLTSVTWNAVNCTLPTSASYCPFYNLTSITNVTIGDSVQVIPNYLFYGCSGITGTVTIPNSVTSIGSQAFYGCSGLTSITIPNSVTSIGYYAFYGCGFTDIINNSASFKFASTASVGTAKVLLNISHTNDDFNYASDKPIGSLAIGNLTIPNSVTSIGNSAFSGCSGLTSVTIPNSVTSIGNSAFSGCSGLTSVTIPNSVTSIGNSAFSGCSGLTSVTIPNSVTSIVDRAFYGCSGLTSVIWNVVNCTLSTNYYDWGPFYNMTSITNVTIGDSVQVIPNYLFYGCSGLTSVTIGNSVTSIGGGAFYGCSGIDTIVSNATTPPTISSNTFSGVSRNIPVLIPCGTYTVYSNYINDTTATYWGNFQHLVVNGSVDTTSYNVSICNRPTDTYTDANFTTPLHNPGTYYAYLTNESGCDSVIVLNLSYYPQVPVTNYSKTICRNGSYTDDNFTNPLVNEGIYEATLQNVNGCDSVVRLTLSMIDPPAQELCIVSVDENNHNEVVWKRDDYTGDTNSNDNISNVVSYVIYKEGNVNGQYDVAATIPYDSLNHWVDTASNAKIRSYRYKVSAIDTCGNESVLSEPHKTMHLTINAGQNNSWNLIWDAYEGMSYQTYNIYRGTSMDTMELIGTMPSSNTSYSDFSAPTNGYVYYVVEIMLDNPCTISKSLTSIRSNIATNNPNPNPNALNTIATTNLSIYPNPAHKEINITCGEKINSIEVVDLLGKVVYQGNKTTIDVSAFAKGNYFVRVQTDKGTITKKVVVE